MKLDFYFDFSSPWSFLAFSQVGGLVERMKDMHKINVEVNYVPVLVGAVFDSVNKSVYELRKQIIVNPKTVYASTDMDDWSEAYGLKILNPYALDASKRVKPFPVNSIKALRGAHYFKKLGSEKFLKYCWAVFESYWSQSRDISDSEVMKSIVEKLGEDSGEFIKFIASNEAKELVRKDVQDCIDRGSFGVPTFFINGKMFFGNDRLILVERQILKACGKDVTGCGIFQPKL